jgi:hypothetical protein
MLEREEENVKGYNESRATLPRVIQFSRCLYNLNFYKKKVLLPPPPNRPCPRAMRTQY